MEVGVGAVQPVCPRRAEHIDIERVFESLCTVRDIGWNVQNFACSNDHFFSTVLTNPEVQCSFEYVRQLLVVMRMLWYDCALVEVHMCNHHVIARNDSSGDCVGNGLLRHVVPAKMSDC